MLMCCSGFEESRKLLRPCRLGCARLAVGEWTAASAAFATGLALAPGNKGMVRLIQAGLQTVQAVD